MYRYYAVESHNPRSTATLRSTGSVDSTDRDIGITSVLVAGQQNLLSKKIYLSGMKYDVKTSKNDVFFWFFFVLFCFLLLLFFFFFFFF